MSKAERKAAVKAQAEKINEQHEQDRTSAGALLFDPSDLTPQGDSEPEPYYLCTKITENVYHGGRQASQDLQHLAENGLSYVLNVTSDAPNCFEEKGLVYKRIPVMDDATTDIKAHFPDAFSFIREAEKQKAKVLVHCHQGLSRSTTIVLAWLIHQERMTLSVALAHLKEKRPLALPNGNFYYQLCEFEKEELGLQQPSLTEKDYFIHMMVTRGWKKDKVLQAIDDAEGDLPKARVALTSV